MYIGAAETKSRDTNEYFFASDGLGSLGDPDVIVLCVYVGIEILKINLRRQHATIDGQDAAQQSYHTGGQFEVSNHGFPGAQRQGCSCRKLRLAAPDQPVHRVKLGLITNLGACSVAFKIM